MQPDPTIERVRKIRHEISEQCDHDPQKLIKYYQKYQQKFSGRLIRKPKIVAMSMDGR